MNRGVPLGRESGAGKPDGPLPPVARFGYFRGAPLQSHPGVQPSVDGPDNPVALLNFILDVIERSDPDPALLDRAVAAASRVRRLLPDLHEVVYWEARCHELAGRREKALLLYQRFRELAEPVARCRPLVVQAALREKSLAPA